MQHNTAVEALVRWLVLAMAGLGLLLVLPSDSFGAQPLLHVAGQPATVANMGGLSVMMLAWLSFLYRLFSMCGQCHRDAFARLLLGIFVVTALGALVVAVLGPVELLVAFTVPAVMAQIALAFRADNLNARRPVRSRELAASSV